MTKFLGRPFLYLVASLLTLAVLYAGARQLEMRSVAIMEQRRSLGSLDSLIARGGEIERLLSAYDTGHSADLFLNAPSPALMSAHLQRQLQHSIAASRAHFIRASEIPPVNREGIDFAGVRLELSGTMESLANTVIAIEAARPLLSIERADFRSDYAARQTDRAPVHTLVLDVTAPMKLPGQAAGGATSR